MSKIAAFYTLEVKDKNGKTTSKVTNLCKSFTIGFLQMLEAEFFPSVVVAIKATDGTSPDVMAAGINFKMEAPVGEMDYGFRVGTGTTPVASDDYVMETPITHGAGAGQLNHGATSKVTTAEVGANVDVQFIRTFTNSSGNTINVTEIGIYSSVTANFIMTLHEVVALTAVPNGQTLTLTITLRTTV